MREKKSSFEETGYLQAMFDKDGTTPRKPTVSESAPVEALTPPQKEKPARAKREKVSDYETTFLKPQETIKDRVTIRIRPEINRRLVLIASRIGKGVSAQAFLENIILHHLDEYQEDISRLYKESIKKDVF